MGGCGPFWGALVAFVIAAQNEIVLFIGRWNYMGLEKGLFPGVFVGFRSINRSMRGPQRNQWREHTNTFPS